MIETARRFLHRSFKTAFPKAWLKIMVARRDPRFEPEFWLLADLVRGRTAVDVGGSEGLFAYTMAGAAAWVHTFEPNPLSLAALRRLRRPNMTIHPVALSDHPGRETLRYDPRLLALGTIEQRNTLAHPGVKADKTFEVELRTLDSFGLESVGFIKIDVEGHEPSVVRGALETIRAGKPLLMIECERRHNPGAFEELLDALGPLGYSPYYWTGERLVEVSPAEVTTLQTLVPIHGSEEPPPGQRYVNNFFFKTPDRAFPA